MHTRCTSCGEQPLSGTQGCGPCGQQPLSGTHSGQAHAPGHCRLRRHGGALAAWSGGCCVTGNRRGESKCRYGVRAGQRSRRIASPPLGARRGKCRCVGLPADVHPGARDGLEGEGCVEHRTDGQLHVDPLVGQGVIAAELVQRERLVEQGARSPPRGLVREPDGLPGVWGTVRRAAPRRGTLASSGPTKAAQPGRTTCAGTSQLGRNRGGGVADPGERHNGGFALEPGSGVPFTSQGRSGLGARSGTAVARSRDLRPLPAARSHPGRHRGRSTTGRSSSGPSRTPCWRSSTARRPLAA
jgi:hypothetical protein